LLALTTSSNNVAPIWLLGGEQKAAMVRICVLWETDLVQCRTPELASGGNLRLRL
jgi:hypothetical protein